jgi:hypothetical protein
MWYLKAFRPVNEDHGYLLVNKARLRFIVREDTERTLYAGHVEEHGEEQLSGGLISGLSVTHQMTHG